jgi:PKD repeat protein/subtilisin family serine protease
MRVTRLSLVFLLAGLFLIPSWAQITVGVLSEDVSRFQPYVSQATQAGQRVTLESFSESALYQQVYTLGALGLARIDAGEILTKWLPQIQGRLLDLTPYAQELQAAGVELYSYGNVVVGVRLPWRDDAFLGILLRSRKAQEALNFLKLFRAAEAKITPLSLSVGPLVVAKTPKKSPGVDGALESFVSALKQAVPTGLVTALSVAPPQAQDALRKVAEMWGIPLSADGASVTLVLEGAPAVTPLAFGAQEAQASPLGLQKVVVPLANLESFLTQMAGKAKVRLPFEPVPMAATSEGVNLVGAAAFHAQGITGAGVKIAVIDVGFAGLSASQARGDLPYSVVTRDFTGTGIDTGLSHGTAVAEIVYDIAPGATLYLVKIANEVDLDNAVTYCIGEGVHIIVHSLGWFNTNFYDGTGTLAQIVNRAASAGILWVQAAGNSGRRHYGPIFTDANSDGWHDTDVTLTANAGDRILLYLTWDSWPQSADDYDLFLFDPVGNLVASSTKTQAGAEQPTERIYTTATVSGTYRVRIQKASGAAKRLALFSVYQDLSPFDAASSLVTPADVDGALSVAAIGWQNYTTGPAQPYSSRGPTKDGRAKPDLSAPDNVTTGVSYYNPFPGTSAAAPHVAGVAALLKAENPGLSAADLRARLLSFCVSMGDPYTYGAGRLEARPQAVALPDLVVDSIVYAPSTPTVGSTVSFTVVVRNQGNASAGQFTVRIQGAGPAHERTVSSLSAGATVTLYFSLPLSTSPETFTVTADVLGQVAESNEDNNTRQVTITGVAAMPDLVVDSITYAPSTPTVGSAVNFTAVVRNQGNAAAGQFTVRLQGGGAYPYQDRTVSSLAAGASVTLTFSLTLSTSPETFTAIADVLGQVAESNEENNTRQVTITGIVPAPQGRLSTDKTSYVLGETVRITFQNTGSVTIELPNTAPWVIKDASGQIVFAPAAAQVITQVAPGETKTWSWDGRDNSGRQVPPGTYTVELTTRNAGTFRTTFTIQAPALPDLIVEDVTYTPTSPTVGTTLTFQIRVRNIGSATAGLFYIGLSGLAGTQYASVSSLGPGAAVTVSLQLPLSASTETFTVTADATNRVTEANETNNTRQITVAAVQPPISLSISTDKPSYTVGEAIRITITLNRPNYYVYVVELDPAGKAILIFPNYWERDPRLPSGTTVLPRTGTYTIQASEPTGSERLYAFAADRPIPYFPTTFPTPSFPVLSTNGAAFLNQVRTWLSGNVASGNWAEASAAITVQPLANQPPVARFTFSPANPLVNQWVTFDATSSYDPDGSIVSYSWDFGDGATATGSRVTKRYSAAGTYTVTLTVTDNRGATNSASQTITVTSPNQPPVASFTFSPANPNPGDTVTFDASASSDPDGSIVSYSWNFGDGNTGSGVTASHVYSAAGTYTVTLTVTDNQGATSTAQKTIQVGPVTTLPGMPVIDKPGIYVWGDPDQHWHITVAGDPSWPGPRKFQVILESPGAFQNREITGSAPAPTITTSGGVTKLTWEGTVGAGWVDLRFDLAGATHMQLTLYLDLDGDGVPKPAREQDRPKLVFLRTCKVNPPYNPFSILAPRGATVPLPNQNFRVGYCVGGTYPNCTYVTWDIEHLEREAGCR